MKISYPCFIIFLFLAIALNKSYAQSPAFLGCHINYSHYVDFGNTNDSSNKYFIIDSSQTNNIWQIGKSYKSSFDSSHVIATDTVNPYPINNVSSFKVGVITCGGIEKNSNPYWFTKVNFHFNFDTDEQKDGLVIETSNNSTNNWRNILLDSNIYIYRSWNSFIYNLDDTLSSCNKPGYSGKRYHESLEVEVNPPNRLALDTTWFRFTFYSDSIQTNKAGFSLNYFIINPVFEGINAKFSKQELEINPNPSNGIIEIKNLPQQKYSDLEIYSIHGKLLQKFTLLENGQIDISSFESGIYLLKSGNKQKRIVKY